MPETSAEATDWQPRYVAYATAHGRAPSAMRDSDRERWPGGPAVGFLLWMGWAWRAWAREAGHPRAKDPYAPLWPADHAAFDAWLQNPANLSPLSPDGKAPDRV